MLINSNYQEMTEIMQNIGMRSLVNGVQKQILYNLAWYKRYNLHKINYLDVGTYQGNSAIVMASALKHQNPTIPVIVNTVDNYSQFLQESRDEAIGKARYNTSCFDIDDILSIHVEEDIELIKSLPDNSIDLVFDDADHGYLATLNRLRNYIPKMDKNSVIAGHDYFVDCPCVVKAVEDFRKEFSEILTALVVDNGMYWMFCKMKI